jgi:hypothetical protein
MDDGCGWIRFQCMGVIEKVGPRLILNESSIEMRYVFLTHNVYISYSSSHLHSFSTRTPSSCARYAFQAIYTSLRLPTLPPTPSPPPTSHPQLHHTLTLHHTFPQLSHHTFSTLINLCVRNKQYSMSSPPANNVLLVSSIVFLVLAFVYSLPWLLFFFGVPLPSFHSPFSIPFYMYLI